MIRRSTVASLLAVLFLLPGAIRAEDKPAEEKKPADKKAVKPVVPVFSLRGTLGETSGVGNPFLAEVGGLSLRELVARMHKAAKDDAVQAVVLFADAGSAGLAQTEELRQAIKKVRDAGKPVYAHSDSLGMGNYLLLCGANRLSVVPTGDLDIVGFYAEAMYLRGLLDMLGVQPEFLTCGDYKSAAEQFLRKSPSPEAERMQNWLLDSMFESAVQSIAAGRDTSVDRARAWIDLGPYTAKRAKEFGLIDAVEHRQEFEAFVKSRHGNDVVFEHKYGSKKMPKLDLSNPFNIFKLFGDMANESKSAKKDGKKYIGVVYVDGAIDLGSSSPSPLSMGDGAFSTPIRKALEEAANDDAIKAVVLRVNSPGGSAVASEIILDATKRVKAKKPFVVSMGDVAASGGYYVACASDVIFADESTITGSIGVVGGKMVTGPLFQKVGITFKEYQRGANAGLMGTTQPWSAGEKARIQSWMDEIYGEFKGHVVSIRGERLKKPIDELAGGRVYTGKQALELGLVDKIGSLDDAIRYVADLAKVTDYEVKSMQEQKNFIEQLFADLESDDRGLVKSAPAGSVVELALPMLKQLDARKARQVEGALRQLDMLNRDRVLLIMPGVVDIR